MPSYLGESAQDCIGEPGRGGLPGKIVALALVALSLFTTAHAAGAVGDLGSNEKSCGPEALVAVARMLGVSITLSEAAERLKTSNGLTTLADMNRAVCELGFHAKWYKLAPADLDRLRCPAVLKLNLGKSYHFVVLLGVLPTSILICDPGGNSGRFDRARFARARLWDGTALLVSRSKETLDRFEDPPSRTRRIMIAGLVVAGLLLLAAALYLELRNRRLARAGTAGLSLLVLVLLTPHLPLYAGEQASPPQGVKIEKRSMFLGEARTMTTLKGEIVLKNDGGCPVTVDKVRSSCKCAVADTKHAVVKVGGKLVIPVSLTSSLAGVIDAVVYVHLEGYAAPLSAKVEGKFLTGISLDPPQLVFLVESGPEGKYPTGERVVTVWAPDNAASVAVESSDESLLISDVPSKQSTLDDSGLQIVRRFAVALKPGAFASLDQSLTKYVKFRIEDRSAAQAAKHTSIGTTDSSADLKVVSRKAETAVTVYSLELPIHVLPSPSIRISPKCLVFLPSGGNGALQRTVTIQAQRGSVTILRVATDLGESLDVNPQQVASDILALHVAVRPDFKRKTGRIQVFVKEQESPLEIAVTVLE